MPQTRYEEIMRSRPYLPFGMGYLTDDMVAKASEELGETEEVKAEAIQEFRKLIESEPNLECPTNDAYLLQYLRARKYNVMKAFALLQNFYLVKKSNRDLYDTFDLDMLKKVYGFKAITFFPYRTKDGCVVFHVQMEKWDTELVSMAEAVTGLTTAILFCVEDIATQVCGVHILLDVKGASLKHVSCITPRYLTLFSNALRNCLPVRFKGIHIFNESLIFGLIWKVFRYFLSDKIRRRVHFHYNNQKQLQKFIPKAILPSEYGGDNASFSIGDWFNIEIEKYFPKYQELTSYGYKQ